MSKRYNICEHCCLPTDGCEKDASQCFYASVHEEKLVCPYCGHKVDDFYALYELGLIDGKEVDTTLNCDECGNAMSVNSIPTYYITASPADETAVTREGHPDYKQRLKCLQKRSQSHDTIHSNNPHSRAFRC